MFKRIMSVLIAATILTVASVCAFSAAEVDRADVGAELEQAEAGAEANVSDAGADTSSEASGAGNYVYFDASQWKGFNQIFCHIWVRGGADFFGWQSRREQCEKDSGSIWKYDISKLSQSTDVEGGLKDGVDYCIIFSANTGVQSYDTTFGLPCIGDTIKLTGNMIENPKDSEKEAFEAVWTKSSANYGPHLAITSIGNIVGKSLCPNESGAEVIGDWLPSYYISPNVDAEATLVKALPKFGVGVDDIQAVYTYIVSKNTGEDEKEMQNILESAAKKAYPSAKPVKIDTEKANDDAKKIEIGTLDVDDLTEDGGSGTGGNASGSGSAGGSGSGGGSYSGGNSSGSGADGPENIAVIVLAGVMAVSGCALLVFRKKEE